MINSSLEHGTASDAADLAHGASAHAHNAEEAHVPAIIARPAGGWHHPALSVGGIDQHRGNQSNGEQQNEKWRILRHFFFILKFASV